MEIKDLLPQEKVHHLSNHCENINSELESKNRQLLSNEEFVKNALSILEKIGYKNPQEKLKSICEEVQPLTLIVAKQAVVQSSDPIVNGYRRNAGIRLLENPSDVDVHDKNVEELMRVYESACIFKIGTNPKKSDGYSSKAIFIPNPKLGRGQENIEIDALIAELEGR